MRIRQARIADVDILTELALRAKASHGYDAAFMLACREELAIRKTTLHEREIWVAEDTAGRIVGFFGLWPPEDAIAEVDPVFAEPNLHGYGIGRALWRKLEDRARAAGAKKLRLDSDPHAVGFYQSMGCTVIGEAPSGSIPGRMLPRMEKVLG